MQANPRRTDDPLMAQRAIILRLLRPDHGEGWPLDHLQLAMTEVMPAAVSDAIIRLEAGGVVYCLDEFVGASRCTRHLDSLGLITR
jgi:hypothetical protein